jgi:hypothetical protein
MVYYIDNEHFFITPCKISSAYQLHENGSTSKRDYTTTLLLCVFYA